MTDRYNALIVVLDRDIRDDDAEPIINAISQINHVQSVKGNVADITTDIAESRVRAKIYEQILEIFK